LAAAKVVQPGTTIMVMEKGSAPGRTGWFSSSLPDNPDNEERF
jgi:hypothetical protein